MCFPNLNAIIRKKSHRENAIKRLYNKTIKNKRADKKQEEIL